jgi:hypothetical protein
MWPIPTCAGTGGGDEDSGAAMVTVACLAASSCARQHCLYFFPLPHGHGALRPIFAICFLVMLCLLDIASGSETCLSQEA